MNQSTQCPFLRRSPIDQKWIRCRLSTVAHAQQHPGQRLNDAPSCIDAICGPCTLEKCLGCWRCRTSPSLVFGSGRSRAAAWLPAILWQIASSRGALLLFLFFAARFFFFFFAARFSSSLQRVSSSSLQRVSSSSLQRVSSSLRRVSSFSSSLQRVSSSSGNQNPPLRPVFSSPLLLRLFEGQYSGLFVRLVSREHS